MVLAAFTDFLQQIVSGLASGGVYALLALALVIIHRSTGVINFAQGEMATLSSYIAWALIVEHGWRYWPAFVATLALSFAGGVAIHRVVIRPVERGNVLRIVIVTIGLLVAVNGFVIWKWGGEPKQLQSPFGTNTYDIGGVIVSAHDIGTIAVALGIVFLLWLLFQFTKVGLALRAAAVNPEEARLVGVRVSVDARARLGARGAARRRRGDAHRADRRARPEHDGRRAHLRLRGGRARRHRLAARRGRRRADSSACC